MGSPRSIATDLDDGGGQASRLACIQQVARALPGTTIEAAVVPDFLRQLAPLPPLAWRPGRHVLNHTETVPSFTGRCDPRGFYATLPGNCCNGSRARRLASRLYKIRVDGAGEGDEEVLPVARRLHQHRVDIVTDRPSTSHQARSTCRWSGL